MKAEQGVLY